MWFSFRPYVSVAQRRANAVKEVAKLAKKGQIITPVKIDGRTIARTFWGKAWCDNLESYSDFENRLPRGRTYVRNGSVVDLQIAEGKITALVSGSELYRVKIAIKPLADKTWKGICCDCSGKIGSLIELLQGKFGQGTMEIVTRHQTGLFPSPAEIDMDCSCPDWAGMCKHVAAVMYGIGARLDLKPELLFTLRKVNHLDLLKTTAAGAAALSQRPSDQATIAEDSLQEVFGIELDASPVKPLKIKPVPPAKAAPAKRSRRAKTSDGGASAGPAAPVAESAKPIQSPVARRTKPAKGTRAPRKKVDAAS